MRLPARLRRNRLVRVTAMCLVLIVLACLAAPWISPHHPAVGSLSRRLEPASREHLLGTDYIGRDVFSRLLHAGRLSLGIGSGAVLLGLVAGGTLGLVAGYFGGAVDSIIMRSVDVMMTFPPILFAIMVVSVLGFSTINIMFAVGFDSIPAYSRLIRGLVINVRSEDFTLAARSVGATNSRIMLRHILPNCMSPLIVFCSLYLGRAILAEAGLSFIGLGIQSPDTSWGVLVAEGREYLRSFPHLSMVPGVAIMITVFCFNVIGDALRDTLDPRLRGT